MISALEYLKAANRMCDHYQKTTGCINCPLSDRNNHLCCEFRTKHPERGIEIVENWAKENPIKTYKDAILDKFPDVDIDTIIINACPVTFFKYLETTSNCLDKCTGIADIKKCEMCWNQEYKEDNNE